VNDLVGRVALISGAARGQGRAMAERLAADGADIVAFDACRDIATVPYPLATSDDLAETSRRVQAIGRSVLTRELDVRDSAGLGQLVEDALARFGRLDVVCCNAGVGSFGDSSWSLTETQWDDVLAVNLTGVWLTCRAAIPAMLQLGNGGSIVMTSSIAGLKGYPRMPHYSAAKHGLVGLMRTLAAELAPHSIRVNCVHPTGVKTPMILNKTMLSFLQEEPVVPMNLHNLMPTDTVEAADVAAAVAWLASDEARFITGTSLPIDAGFLLA
jgi:SDR family mycofactocin-dependent oxidoreductase